MPVYRLDDRLCLPPAADGRGRAAGGGRRPAAGAAGARLLAGHLPLVRAGTADPVALARPAHGAAGRGAARPAQPGARSMRRGPYTFTLDTRVRRRSSAPARAAPRPGQRSTWITPADARAYVRAAPARARPLRRGVARRRRLVGRALRRLAGRRVLRRVDVRARRPTRRRSPSSRLVAQLVALGHRARRLPGATRSTWRASARRSGRVAATCARCGKALHAPHTPWPLAVRRGLTPRPLDATDGDRRGSQDRPAGAARRAGSRPCTPSAGAPAT